MLAGVRAFEGDDVSDTMASVLKSDPDWERLPAGTPLVIRRLLRRCLAKDRKKRLPDIAVARLDIDDALSSATLGTDEARVVQVKTPTRRRAVVPIAAALVGAAIAIGVALWLRPKPTSPEIVKFTATLGDTFSAAVNNDQDLTISPDGRRHRLRHRRQRDDSTGHGSSARPIRRRADRRRRSAARALFLT